MTVPSFVRVRRMISIRIGIAVCLLPSLLFVGPSAGLSQNLKPLANDSTAEIPPVKRIVLFNSGIAQVIRAGEIDGNQKIEFRIDTDAVDDVLKSIVFDDQAGQIRAVEYQPAPEKSDLAARELGPPMTVAQMLQSFRGESITLKLESGAVTGRIVGVETRSDQSKSVELVTILAENGLSSWPLEAVKSFQFDSETVREQFRLGMIGLSNSRSTDQQVLTLLFEGAGKRDVRFAYVIDAPIWRMTYRLDLRDARTLLQGWAHVDNVTGTDWDDVQLDLRSGRPQSFNADVFAPLIAQRPSVGTSVFGIPEDLNFTRQTIESLVQNTISPDSWYDTGGFGGGFGGGMGGGFGGGFGGGGGGGGFGGGGGVFGAAAPNEAAGELDISSSVQTSATQGKASQMVRFIVDKPVNLASGKSAMLPVLAQPITPKLVTRFELFALSDANPSAELVVKFTNDSKFAQLAGPIAIYQDGNFIGDAKLSRTDIGDEIELVYGTDQALSIESQSSAAVKLINKVGFAKDQVDKTKIRFEGTNIFKRQITVSNKDSARRTALVKIKLEQATSTPPPEKIDDDIASYLFDVDAASDISKEITFSTAFQELKSVRELTPEVVSELKQNGATIAEDVLTLTTRLNQLEKTLNEQAREQQELTNQAIALKSEQTRLARLIDSLKSDAAAQQPFVDKLVKSESDLSLVTEKLEGTMKQISGLRNELDSLLKPQASD